MSRRARITLPPLTSEQALAVVDLLEHAIAAIWRTHGEAMADHLAMLGVDTPATPDAITTNQVLNEDPF